MASPRKNTGKPAPVEKPVPAAPAAAARETRTAPHDMCLFHKTEPSRFFKAGEEIPDGYRDEPFEKEV